MDMLAQFCTTLALLLFALSGGYWMGRRIGWRDGFYEGTHKYEDFYIKAYPIRGRHMKMMPKCDIIESTGGTESDASSG